MGKAELTKEIAKVLANNSGETVLDDDLKRIRTLFRVWLREHLDIKSLFVLEYKIQAFLNSDRGWKLSEEKRDLFKEVTDMIDRVEAISWYCVQTPDVATKEELLSKTLGDMFPTLQRDLDRIIEGVLSSSNRLQQNIDNMQGDDGIVQKLKAEILKVFADVQGKAGSLKDGLDKRLCDYDYAELEFSDLSRLAHSSGVIEGTIRKIKGRIGGIVIGLVIVLLVYCTMEEAGESSTKAVKGLDRGLYYVSVVGGLAYLVWVVGSSYCY
ncbi:hypothetical protein KMI_23g20130, partial [Encephalitozoon hellem]